MLIACPHFSVSIRTRGGSSAVAGAAYAAGQNLFSEYEQKIKYYAGKHKEVLWSEILLPTNAPKEYLDRETLWNSVEMAEKSYNSQLARNIVAALPNEIPKEQLPGLVREFCQKQFVDKGMCCDFSIHDKGDGNPHVHILLSLRAIDENGNWLPKCRKVYDLDENGEKIKLPSGEWKSHREDLTDWNKKENCELWRNAWAEIQNKYYEINNIDMKIDLRSYEKQGIDKLPSVHLGPYASQLEAEGTETELGNFNRNIAARNSEKEYLSDILIKLREWVKRLAEKIAKLKVRAEREPTLTDYLIDYMNLRQNGRSDWGLSLRKERELRIKDLKDVAACFTVLQGLNIRTIEELENVISKAEEKAKTNAEIKKTKQIISHLKDYRKYKETYLKSKPPEGKRLGTLDRHYYDEYRLKHKDEIDKYIKAVKYLKINNIGFKSSADDYEKKLAALKEKLAGYGDDYLDKDSDKFKSLKKIQRHVENVLDDMQVKPVAEEPVNEKASVIEKLNRNKALIKESGQNKTINNIKER